jgi:hypothetical protein
LRDQQPRALYGDGVEQAGRCGGEPISLIDRVKGSVRIEVARPIHAVVNQAARSSPKSGSSIVVWHDLSGDQQTRRGAAPA